MLHPSRQKLALFFNCSRPQSIQILRSTIDQRGRHTCVFPSQARSQQASARVRQSLQGRVQDQRRLEGAELTRLCRNKLLPRRRTHAR